MNLDDMLPGNVTYIEEVYDDFLRIDGSMIASILKGIAKVATNPKSQAEGGYGKPLGNKDGNDLTGLQKIKFKKHGIRCVYKCIEVDESVGMEIIIVGIRESNKVYKEAASRRKKHNM